jgi:hypothetical protein
MATPDNEPKSAAEAEARRKVDALREAKKLWQDRAGISFESNNALLSIWPLYGIQACVLEPIYRSTASTAAAFLCPSCAQAGWKP